MLITINWGMFIYGVNSGHVVETSLGYFINPLVTVALAVTVVGERLRRAQWVAVAIARLAVVVLTVAYGRPPWIALTLAFSFGFYGLRQEAGRRRRDAEPRDRDGVPVRCPRWPVVLWLRPSGNGHVRPARAPATRCCWSAAASSPRSR